MARAFRIDMNAANERPAGASTSSATAIGVAVLTGAGASARLEYTINVRGLDWGAFTGQPNQTASATDNVNNAHFHQAASNANGPVRFDWKVHDVNDGDSTDDEFTATGLALDGATPIARVHGVWETTDPVSLTGFLGSFTNPALALGGANRLLRQHPFQRVSRRRYPRPAHAARDRQWRDHQRPPRRARRHPARPRRQRHHQRRRRRRHARWRHRQRQAQRWQRHRHHRGRSRRRHHERRRRSRQLFGRQSGRRDHRNRQQRRRCRGDERLLYAQQQRGRNAADHQ